MLTTFKEDTRVIKTGLKVWFTARQKFDAFWARCILRHSRLEMMPLETCTYLHFKEKH